MNELIRLSKINKIYSSKNNTVHALHDIDLTINRGDFVSVIGKSGSGKSTLMNILGCLDSPTDGEYLLDGKNVERLSNRQLTRLRNTTIGFIFQGFNLIPTMTALENVELPLIYRGIKKSERKLLSAKALDSVGLGHRISHTPGELSGGQQQRVAIARALAGEPKLILADEPTGNLDSKSGNEIMSILKALNKNGSTIVLITHNTIIANMAEYCIKISDGKIIS